MIRHLELNKFQLLIHHEPIYYFTMPDIARSSVHDKKNWIYDLERVDENDIEEEESDPLTPPHYYDPPVGLEESELEIVEACPVTPPRLDYYLAWDPPTTFAATAVHAPQIDHGAAIITRNYTAYLV